jgi:F-type H+-transporting ATPase subunit b
MADWLTIAFQIVNFLVLLILLRVLLYRRIIQAMDRRRERIAADIADAQRRQAEADAQTAEFRAKNEHFDRDRNTMLDEAKMQAEARRLELTHQAQQDVAARKQRWTDALQQQQEEFLSRLRREAGEGLCAIARKALADLADADLEERVIATFRARLEAMDAPAIAEIAEALSGKGEAMVVRSGWEIPQARRDELAAALRAKFGRDRQVRFAQSDDVICGLEIRAGGHAVGWNAASYVDSVARRIRESLALPEAAEAPQAADAPAAQAGPVPGGGDGGGGGKKAPQPPQAKPQEPKA